MFTGLSACVAGVGGGKKAETSSLSLHPAHEEQVRSGGELQVSTRSPGQEAALVWFLAFHIQLVATSPRSKMVLIFTLLPSFP